MATNCKDHLLAQKSTWMGTNRTLEGHHPVSEEVVRAHEGSHQEEGSLTEAMPVFKCEEL